MGIFGVKNILLRKEKHTQMKSIHYRHNLFVTGRI